MFTQETAIMKPNSAVDTIFTISSPDAFLEFETDEFLEFVKFLEEMDEIEATNRSTSRCYIWSIMMGILIGCIAISPLMLIPQHNILELPEYWYEFMLIYAFVGMGCFSSICMFTCIYWMNTDVVKNWTSFFIMYVAVVICLLPTHSLYYLIWVYAWGYSVPMPFTMYGVASVVIPLVLTTLWFRYNISRIL